MYESFYKLHPTPFRLTPDPHFFFESETHKRGLAYLRFAFYQREGFVVISGAPGTGKTELTLNLIEELPHNNVTVARIVNTNLDADALLDLVAESFKIDIKNVSKGSELKKLEEFFISQARIGKQVLLIIDEAHNLSVKSLLELSMLENFQIDEKPIMQCLLLGQLPLEEKLNLPELEPLKQRVIASTRLETLNQQETRDYVIHRLTRSGWNNNPIIHDEALFFIHHYANGIPRKINLLCNRLLLHSYVEGRHEIGPYTVNKVAQEIQEEGLVDGLEEGLKESLDLDFADIQSDMEPTPASQQNDAQQPNLAKESAEESPEENQAQQAAMSNNRLPINKESYSDNADKNADRYSVSSNNIDIPEFIRITPDQNAGRQLRMLKEIQEPEPHESQWQQTASSSNGNYQSWEADTIPTESSVATASHVATQPGIRRSGLHDRDLQFLSSLAASTALDTITAEQEAKADAEPEPITEAEPLENPEQVTISDPEQAEEYKTVPARKLIVDESVYDENPSDEFSELNIIIDESVYDGDEHTHLADDKDWQKPEIKPPALNIWQPVALAAIVSVSLIVSITWLYDGDSEPANVVENVVADNQTEMDRAREIPAEAEVFAAAAPVDIELPGISSPSTSIEAKAIDKTVDEGVSQTGNAITSIATDAGATDPVTTASAAETIASTDKTSAAETSNASDKSESAELDTQLTQILEHTDPAPAKPKNIAGNKPSATIKSDTPKSDAIPQHDKTVAETSPDNSALKNGKTIVDKSTASTSQAIASTSAVIKKIKPDLLLSKSSSSESSLNKSPQGKPANKTPSAVSPAAVSMANTSRNLITNQPEVYISQADLTTLLFRLSNAYQTGDLQQLVTTFAADINSSDGSNRRQMLKEYQRLFNITDQRQLSIQDVKWSTKDRQVTGKGDFEVSIREKGATKYTTYQGKIHFAVARESNKVVIKKLDYDYGQ